MFRQEKRSFNKVKETITNKYLRDSVRESKIVKETHELQAKDSDSSEVSTDSFDDSTKLLQCKTFHQQKIQKQQQTLNRKVSFRIDQLLSNTLSSPLSTLNTMGFKRKSPIPGQYNIDLPKSNSKFETIYEKKSTTMLNVPELNLRKKSSHFSSDTAAPFPVSSKLNVPFKEKELGIMNTTELLEQLFTVLTLKSFEYRGKDLSP